MQFRLRTLMLLMAAGLITTLCCAGICGSALFYVSRFEKNSSQAKASVRSQLPRPPGQPDRMVTEMLMRAYTTALDAVVADKGVIERLGEPIEPDNDSDELFRRERRGRMTSEDETIEYDISGPKGKAVVLVVSTGAIAPPGRPPLCLAKKITVEFDNGTHIDVPSPVVPAVPARKP